MSRQKSIILLLFALLVGGATGLMGEARENRVLRFYVERAAGQAESRDPQKAGLSYEMWVRAYLTHVGRGGKVEVTDSAVFGRYYGFGDVDSQKVTVSTSERLTDLDLTHPNVFRADYDFHFYPNDTGGAELPIGFESDTLKNLSPVGMAVIDRAHYHIRRLYLYYPNEARYERYSRTISFRLQDGFVFPDTMAVLYSEAGIFAVEHYRIDAYVDSVRIYRGGGPGD